jgi:hypothetical protein
MNRAEMNILCDQFNPPDISKKEFCRMILDVTADSENANGSKKINFLLIVKGVEAGKRFRRNLDEYILVGDTELKNKDTVVQHEFSSDDEPEPDVKLNMNKNSQTVDKPELGDMVQTKVGIAKKLAKHSVLPSGKTTRRPLLFNR